MQRRAAALYVAFFLVVGAAAFTLIATASPPHLSFENPEYELGANETFTVDGQRYTVTEISAQVTSTGGGGHGGGGGGTVTRSGTIQYVNQSARYTTEWANGSTVSYDGQNWTVVVESGDSPNQFTLRETIDRAAILRNDSSVENQTVTQNGTEYVVRTEGENRTLVPADEYFPEPQTRQFSEGEQFRYQGNQTTVAAVRAGGATLEWFAPRTVQVDVSNNANVTLGNTTFFAHLPNNETLLLTNGYDEYQAHQRAVNEHNRMKNGLWGVTALSGLVAFILTGLAYLPSRY